MNKKSIALIALALATLFSTPAAFADPSYKAEGEARKQHLKYQHEKRKHLEEMERESRKHHEEMQREKRKYREEMKREKRKHHEEMEREGSTKNAPSRHINMIL